MMLYSRSVRKPLLKSLRSTANTSLSPAPNLTHYLQRHQHIVTMVQFINASPTPFHAVHNASERLESAGFQRIYEKDNWEKQLKEGGRYFFTRSGNTLVDYLGRQIEHPIQKSIFLDSVHNSQGLEGRRGPLYRRSPGVQTFQSRLLAVETYGGGIWHSWFDRWLNPSYYLKGSKTESLHRDLSLAGRVIVTDKNSTKFTSRLVNLKRPLLRIPTLAIHLDRTVNDNFKFNQETQFIPILGQVASQLNGPPVPETSDKNPVIGVAGSNVQTNHHASLIDLIAEDISVSPEEIHDFELCLYDVQPSQAGGINNEFIFSPRLDNLMSSFCAVEAMADSVSSDRAVPLEGNVNVIALFNHEEIGSVSTSGAESSLLPTLFHRLSPTPAAHAQSISRSFLVSADMGHAIHPSYMDSHEQVHRPEINGGLVVKTNAKQRYATDAVGTFLIRKLVENRGGRIQEFEVRNDMPCGSTVGPMLSKLGLRTVDVGMPMLSMHSIRETGGTKDVQYVILPQLYAARSDHPLGHISMHSPRCSKRTAIIVIGINYVRARSCNSRPRGYCNRNQSPNATNNAPPNITSTISRPDSPPTEDASKPA
ncbi:aspartyl aminopeptidase [Rhizoctonia solani AG-1 IA]|uniref:aspartyl aminopeptidase n=1 Tax=Thanatephorus cucumeris (strain AG1-IA) TaxID=983506 RepID=L8X9W4_THACA|nr:aspartyl aminopeptidase [Rhizoctonia solani AG-1 IA]